MHTVLKREVCPRDDFITKYMSLLCEVDDCDTSGLEKT